MSWKQEVGAKLNEGRKGYGRGGKRNGQTHCCEEWEKMPSFVDDTSHKEQEIKRWELKVQETRKQGMWRRRLSYTTK